MRLIRVSSSRVMYALVGASLVALAGMAAVLIAMALTADMRPQLQASVLSFLVAVGAFLLVDARRKARAAAAVSAAPGS